MGKAQIVVCGSIAIDRIMNFSGHYRELIESSKIEVLSVSVLVDSLDISQGGTGANIAYNLAALGEAPVLLGAVGADAADYLERLAKLGVDVSGVYQSRLATASFNVLTDSAGNQVGGFYPGAMSDAELLSFAPWAGKDALVCLSAHDPVAMRRMVAECAEKGLRLVYDPGQQVSNISGDDLRAGVEAAEVVIVNEYELSLLSKKTGLSEADLRATVPVLISTHGEHGSVIGGKEHSEPVKIASAKPANITDPTGAGDAYRAGFLYGYLRQWEPRKCGQLGSVVASFALEQHGTQAELSPADIARRYQENFNEEIEL